MPWVDLPVKGGTYKNISEESLNAVGASLLDGYLDEFGNVVGRPGLVEFCDLGTGEPVDGIYWWPVQKIAIAVSGKKVFKITDSNGSFVDITGDAPEKLIRPTFADFGTALYLANGGRILKLTPSGTTAAVADVDAPTAVNFVAVLDKYLFGAEKDTAIVWFSDVAAPDSWSGDYFEPETKPDYVGALHAEYGEIYTFGRESTERWYDDGSSPWAHNPQGDTGRGWIAPYSVVAVDNGFIGLDEDRQVVKLQGASYQVLSPAVNAYIQGFETVADARGDHIVISGRPFYILSFPTEGKTLVYNYTLPGDVPSTWLGWSEWTRFNAVTASHEAFLGNCHAYSDKWNLNLVGDRRTGKIWKLDTSATTDGGGAIRTVRRTGFIDHGKYGHKKSRSLRVRIKRSQQGGKLLVRWRDRAQENAWSSFREYSLGDSGDLEQIVTIHQLGRYQTRQWEFVLSDNAQMLLMGAQEFVE